MTAVHESADAAPVVAGPPTPRHLGAITAGLVLGVSLAALDMTIVATAVRTIADDLGGVELQAWTTTAYLVTAAISTPLYGRLSDVHGRKPLFLVAISVFVAGSPPCSIARSMPELTGFAGSTSLVFAVGAVVLVVGLVAALLLPDEQLSAGDE